MITRAEVEELGARHGAQIRVIRGAHSPVAARLYSSGAAAAT